MNVAVAIVAKQCLPGRVKTRLCPPLVPDEAAHVARACLDDTVAVVRSLDVARRVIFWDGDPAAAPAGFEVVPQPAGTLDARLGALFDRIAIPLVLIGMDTPQVTRDDLAAPLERWPDDVDAWIGGAADGGFWALAVREPDGDLVRGVAMSRPDTGARQRVALHARGLRVAELPVLVDVDDARAAERVAALAPGTRFARAWRSVRAGALR